MAIPAKKGGEGEGGGGEGDKEKLTRLLLTVAGCHVWDLLLVDTNE